MQSKTLLSFMESGFSSALKALAGFVAVLLITRSFGGDALVSYSQLGSLTNFSIALTAFGVFNGVTRELSLATPSDQERILSGVGVLGGLTFIFFSLGVLLIPDRILEVSPEFRHERGVIALAIPLASCFVVVGASFLSLQSSRSNLRSFTRTHSFASVVVILATGLLYLLAPDFLIYFALLSPLSPYVVASLRGGKLWRSVFAFRRTNLATLKRLMSYFPPAFMQTLFPLFYIILRNSLMGRLEIEKIASWQLVMRVSDAYMGIIFTILVSKVLGEFAKSADAGDRKNLLRTIMPNAGFILFATLGLVVSIDAWTSLFNMAGKVSVQDVWLYGIGDSLRIASNVIYFYFLSRRQTSVCVLLDVFQLAFLSSGYCVAVMFLPGWSLSVGHALCHLLFLVTSLTVLSLRRRA